MTLSFAGNTPPLSNDQYKSALTRFRQYAGFGRTEAEFLELASMLGFYYSDAPLLAPTPQQKARAVLSQYAGSSLFLWSSARGSKAEPNIGGHEPVPGMGSVPRWYDDLKPTNYAWQDGSGHVPRYATQEQGGVGGYEGIKSVKFSGAQWLNLTPASAFQTTVIVAARSTDNFAQDQVIVNPCAYRETTFAEGFGLIKFTSAGLSVEYTGAELAAPFERDDKPKVITSRYNGAYATLRLNGVEVAYGSPVFTGTYTGLAAMVGRGNSVEPGEGNNIEDCAYLTGDVYALAIIQGAISDEEVLAIEQWFNLLTPSTDIF